MSSLRLALKMSMAENKEPATPGPSLPPKSKSEDELGDVSSGKRLLF
jgi:hypothetical protein